MVLSYLKMFEKSIVTHEVDECEEREILKCATFRKLL